MVRFKKNKSIENTIKKISKNLDKNEEFRNKLFPNQRSTILTDEIQKYINNHSYMLGPKKDIVDKDIEPILEQYNDKVLNFLNNEVEFIQASVIFNSTLPAFTIQHKGLPKYNEYLKEQLDLIAYDKDIEILGFENSFSSFVKPTIYDYMSIKPSIESANGNILILGIRNGLYPYLAALNPNVKNITIVENDVFKIDFFNQEIIKKIKFSSSNIDVIFNDPVNFLKEQDTSIYNKIFVNNYDDEYEGLHEYKRYLVANKHKDIEFWLESLILQNIKEMVFTYLQLIYSSDNKDIEVTNKIFIELLSDEYTKVALSIINKFKELDITIFNEKDFLNYINNDKFIRDIIVQI